MKPALWLLPIMAALQAPQEPAVFHSGTRLVEVEVVVRNQRVRPPGVGEWFKWTFDSGPPFGPPGDVLKGLTKEHFTLLDDGMPQQIAVFRAGATGAGLSSEDQLIALPPGAVSNRRDSSGQPVSGATAVLVDFLNTDFGCRAYERLGMTNLLRAFSEADSRIALYTLGANLHTLHDFTDDPQNLMEMAATLDRHHGPMPAELASAMRDLGDVMAVGGGGAEAQALSVHAPITVSALRVILQRLSAVPGRKNLIWMMEDSLRVPPEAMAMARRANVVVYPVLARLTGSGYGPDASCSGASAHAAEDLAAVTGGRAFFDALDLPSAVRTTEEDTSTAYIIGYYPAEEMLDGKYHKITVKIDNKASGKETLEVQYRPGYLATKTAFPTLSPTREELFEGRFNAEAIALTAQTAPEAGHPGSYDVRVTVDLHDIHMQRKDGHFIGGFDLSVPNPAIKGTVYSNTVWVDLTDAQFADALENGFAVVFKGAEPEAGEIRVVVRDRATGIAGSLRIPTQK